MGEPLGLLQLLLARAQRHLDTLALGDLGERQMSGPLQLELHEHQLRQIREQSLVLGGELAWLVIDGAARSPAW
jgi:hypothetical protein